MLNIYGISLENIMRSVDVQLIMIAPVVYFYAVFRYASLVNTIAL